MNNIADGNNNALRRVLAIIKTDVRSTAGKNLRYLMIKTENYSAKELSNYKELYQAIPNNESWRIQMINELIEAKSGDLSIFLSKKEIDNITEFICCE